MVALRARTSVVVIARWSCFYGRRGVITQKHPHLMVLLEGEREPLRFGEIAIAEESAPKHIGGAE